MPYVAQPIVLDDKTRVELERRVATATGRNNSVTFTDFLPAIDLKGRTDLAINLIMDNGRPHVSKATKGWLVEHARVVAHYIPVHARWMNRVVLLDHTRKGHQPQSNFTSRDDLVSKLMRCIASFAWDLQRPTTQGCCVNARGTDARQH